MKQEKYIQADRHFDYLKTEKLLNISYLAEKLYPDVKLSSANAKFNNKLKKVNGFRFTPAEQLRLYDLLKGELMRLYSRIQDAPKL